MRILVPVDGSPASIRAVKLALDQVKSVKEASIVLINVQNFATIGDATGIMPLAWIEQEQEKAITEALEEAVIMCRDARVNYVTRSERGAVAATTDRVAREEHVTHNIMGTRGHSGRQHKARSFRVYGERLRLAVFKGTVRHGLVTGPVQGGDDGARALLLKCLNFSPPARSG
jgi:nucleotide-binding universal stress UspA family protein